LLLSSLADVVQESKPGEKQAKPVGQTDHPIMEITDGQTILYGYYRRSRTEADVCDTPPLSPYARGYAISMVEPEDKSGRKRRLYYSPGPRRQWTGSAGFAEIFSSADAAREHLEEHLFAISSRCAVIAL